MNWDKMLVDSGNILYAIGGAIFIVSAVMFLITVSNLNIMCPPYVEGHIDIDSRQIIGICSYQPTKNSFNISCVNSERMERKDNNVGILQYYIFPINNTEKGNLGRADLTLFDKKV